MAVHCEQVAAVLAKRGLQRPELEILKPTHQSYRALLLQPSGPVFADGARIGHRNSVEAELRCAKLLELAAAQGHHLVVVPEYCLPVATLLNCVHGDAFPAEGAIWVLGCESITPAGLAAFVESVGDACTVVHEDDPAAAVQGTYFDALAYCFQARDEKGAAQRVVVFQFKTAPSRDPHFLENQHLRLGQTIYQFRNADEHFGLAAIICSDAFSIAADNNLCTQLTNSATLIHIQLNPDPRHVDYKRYRSNTFSRSAAFSDCDIVCLNWARNVSHFETDVGPAIPWSNIGGSAWYLPKHRCSTADHEVSHNDSKGLYYSLLEKRRHVLLFHYDEAVFELTVPKIANLGEAVLENPIGPKMDCRREWDAQSKQWQPVEASPDAGFDALLAQDALVGAALAPAAASGRTLNIERAVALSCGPHEIAEKWHAAERLEACQMKADEIVRRTTFCMDPCMEASTVRHERLQQVAALDHILANEVLPPQVKDLSGGGCSIKWSSASPNTNVKKDDLRPALVAYLGATPLPKRIRDTSDAMVELLRKEGGTHQRRVAICYRKVDGGTAFEPLPALTRIDHDGGSLTRFTTVIGESS